MNNKFKHVYLKMIYEHIGIIDFNEQTYLNFLKNSIKFKNNKIISEDKDLLIDVPDDLINYCIDHQDIEIDFNTIKLLMKNSKHYSNVKNLNLNEKLYFSIFDFNNDNEINEFHVKFFKNIDSDEIENANHSFKEYCSILDGICNSIDFKPINLCLINSNNNDIYSIIYHELSHIIQTLCNIRITTSSKFKKENIGEKENLLLSLNLTYNDLYYFFKETEFNVHIDDLINGLWKTYIKFYKNKYQTIFQYTLMICNEFKKGKNFKNSQFIQDYALANNSNVSPLLMYAASFFLNHKFQKIKNIVQIRLTNKFNKIK